MRHSKRVKLTVDDVNAALRVKNVEVIVNVHMYTITISFINSLFTVILMEKHLNLERRH